MEQGVLRVLRGEETPWGKLFLGKNITETLLSWKLCASELGVSDLQNSFSFFFVKTEAEAVNAVRVCFFQRL